MKTRVETNASFLALMAVAMVLIPLKWLIAWVVAAAFHELCHLTAMRCFKCNIHSIKIAPGGAIIDGSPLQNLSGLICEAAGPIGSLALLLVARWLPAVAVCGFVQGVFNFLPFHPLDGYKLLNRFLSIWLPAQWSSYISLILRILAAFVLVICGMWLYKMQCGPIPLLIAILVAISDCKNTLQNRGREGTIVLPVTNEV